MTEAPLMYGAVADSGGSGDAEALLSQPPVVPKSIAQAAAPYVAEFVGTFTLVLVTGCCLLAPGDPVWNATAIGCIFMVMVYATSPVSGANLNPAVSFTLGLVGCLPWPVVLGYWAAQLAGGISAGFFCCALFSPRTVHVEPQAPFTWEYAGVSEVIYTGMMCFVFLNCVVSRRNNPPDDANQFHGLALGFSLAVGGYAVGGVSGALFNPAVALGLDVSAAPASFTGWSFCWLVFELLGAAVAAALFRIIRVEEFGRNGCGGVVAISSDFEPDLPVRCLSEFLGTFIVVFTVCVSVVLGSPYIAWSGAAALLCMFYSLSNVSGGHFNPAVTLATVLRGKCSLSTGFAYWTSQSVGGALAGIVSSSFHAAGPHRYETYQLSLGWGVSAAATGIAELFFTFVLVYVVLACGTTATPSAWRSKRNNYAALAIAGACAGGGLASSFLSGGQLNPAICLGLVTSCVSYHAPGDPPAAPFANFVAFSFWELAGGLLAAAAFRRTHTAEFRNAPLLAK